MALPWLDAARYADSNSYQFDDNRFAWPWRDWLIRQYSTSNRPFDDVIVEMLAGDLLPEPNAGPARSRPSFNRNHFINGEGGAIKPRRSASATSSTASKPPRPPSSA